MMLTFWCNNIWMLWIMMSKLRRHMETDVCRQHYSTNNRLMNVWYCSVGKIMVLPLCRNLKLCHQIPFIHFNIYAMRQGKKDNFITAPLFQSTRKEKQPLDVSIGLDVNNEHADRPSSRLQLEILMNGTYTWDFPCESGSISALPAYCAVYGNMTSWEPT